MFLSTALISQHSLLTHIPPTSLTETLADPPMHHLFGHPSLFFCLKTASTVSYPHTYRPIHTFCLLNFYSFLKTHNPAATSSMTITNCFSNLKVLAFASTTPLNTSSTGPNTPHSQSNLLYFLFQAIHFNETSTRSSYITADF